MVVLGALVACGLLGCSKFDFLSRCSSRRSGPTPAGGARVASPDPVRGRRHDVSRGVMRRGGRGSSGFTRPLTADDRTPARRGINPRTRADRGSGTHDAHRTALWFSARNSSGARVPLCTQVYALGALIALWLSTRVATPSAFLLTPLENGRAGQCCFSRAASSMGALLGLESRWAAPCSNRSSMPPLLTCGMRSRPTSPRCLGARFR